MNCLRLCFTVAVLLLSQQGLADADRFAALHGLSGTKIHPFQSEVLGRDLNIIVRTPRDYDPSSAGNVAVYVLDGGVLFPLIAGYDQYLSHESGYPKPIIVGIGYPGATFPTGNMRSTDYTAPSVERDFWGGAERFQKVLSDEVIPFVENLYATDSSRRVIFGQSIGGQFVIYTAMTKPELFWGHIASNPALHRNLDFFTTVKPRSTKTKLFVSLAEHDAEQFRIPAAKWAEHWQAQENRTFDLKVFRPADHGHFSVAPVSYWRGMGWLFSDGAH